MTDEKIVQESLEGAGCFTCECQAALARIVAARDEARRQLAFFTDGGQTITVGRKFLADLEYRAEAAEADRDRYAAALREIADGYDGDEFEDTADAFDRHQSVARAALKDETP